MRRARRARIVWPAMVLAVGACAASADGWAHAEPGRSHAEDAARCEVEARRVTLERRGGEPLTLEERQRFATDLRRATQLCMRSLGWRPAHETSVDPEVVL